jgi:hypothetical protein
MQNKVDYCICISELLFLSIGLNYSSGSCITIMLSNEIERGPNLSILHTCPSLSYQAKKS